MLVALTESIPISYDEGEWHGAFSSVMDNFEDRSIKNSPKELLLYMYENTLCSFCRCVVVKEMGRRRMLTDELLQECLYDSNNEIREYAKRRLEDRKPMLEKFIGREDKRIDKAAADQILKKFKNRFVISDYDPGNQRRSWLLHCNLSCETRQIATEDFESIPFDRKKKVYFYSERHRKMYQVTFAEVCRLVAGLGPWEDIDAEIFDDSYEWLIAITHEDVTLLYGL